LFTKAASVRWNPVSRPVTRHLAGESTMPLTARQSQVVSFIEEYRREKGYSPTQREMASRLGIGVNSVRIHLDTLEIKSIIKREGGKRRNVVMICG